MKTVTALELRRRTSAILDRVASGERLVITRYGVPVAELRNPPEPAPTREELLERWRRLPALDPAKLRADLDAVIDPRMFPDEPDD